MKTFKEFRTECVLNPSKEMIIESEISSAYDKYKLNLLTIYDASESFNCDCKAPTYRDKYRNHRCTKCKALNNSD